MSYVRTSGSAIVPKLQAPALLDQIAVQNAWYTVLDTTRNIRLVSMAARVTVANETVEIRITIDGRTITASDAWVFDTGYVPCLAVGSAGFWLYAINTTDMTRYRSFMIEAQSIKIEIRKTTANNAAAHLQVAVEYETLGA